MASYKCGYGDYLSADQIPEVPEKDGYYGVWPDYDFSDITGNKVLEAEYEEWTASIASAEKNDNNKALVMAEASAGRGKYLYSIHDQFHGRGCTGLYRRSNLACLL